MRYLMLVCRDESITIGPEQGEEMGRLTDWWVGETDGRGVRLHGDRLGALSDATTVRVRQGEVLISDGPFAETKEHIAGYDLFECESIDEAVNWAAQHPVAAYGCLEVRPVWPGAIARSAEAARPVPPKTDRVRYFFTHFVDEALVLSEEEAEQVEETLGQWLDETQGSGANLDGGRLAPVRTAKTVRVRDGETLVCDGPFAETKEQVGGFDIIEFADLDAAIESATKHPTASIGTIEVRPFWRG